MEKMANKIVADMTKLNFMFRNKNKPTDVLSFPTQDHTKNNLYIGDIAISFEKGKK